MHHLLTALLGASPSHDAFLMMAQQRPASHSAVHGHDSFPLGNLPEYLRYPHKISCHYHAVVDGVIDEACQTPEPRQAGAVNSESHCQIYHDHLGERAVVERYHLLEAADVDPKVHPRSRLARSGGLEVGGWYSF